MVLVDKDIIQRNQEIFINGYNQKNVQSISYDIHVKEIITDDTNVEEYDLNPQQAIMVRCIEEISVPMDLMIKIENKNSLIRNGISIVAPVYNPGHRTPIYIRVENISSNIFKITKDMPIAQLIFIKLSSKPDITYDQQGNASFNEEWKYKGLSKTTMKKEHAKLKKQKKSWTIKNLQYIQIFLQ